MPDQPDGPTLVERKPFVDERGAFARIFCAEALRHIGWPGSVAQINHSRTDKAGTLRGLHYQIQQPQGKLVSVVAGEVFDVAVDVRRSSPTYGEYVGVILSAENKCSLWIPPGFAHGFLVLSDTATFEYKCTDYYHPESELSLAWDDATVGVKWPIPEGAEPQLSGKDRAGTRWQALPLYRGLI